MKKSHFRIIAVSLFAVLVLPLFAASPLAVIRTSNSEALRIQAGKSTLDPATERALMRVIDGVTSFSVMSKQVMEWIPSSLTAAQRAKFDERFQKLLRVSSVKKAGRYRAKGFQYLGVRYAGATAIVRTIALYKNDRVALDYSLKRMGGVWKIVDYNVDGIGTVDNYRKMFRILFRRKSFDGVIATINRSITRYEQQK